MEADRRLKPPITPCKVRSGLTSDGSKIRDETFSGTACRLKRAGWPSMRSASMSSWLEVNSM
ncbi:hypothetical protein D3C86_2033350 [compost metagenome]